MVETKQNTVRGVFRDQDGWATVDYGAHRASIPRHSYDENGYEPPFEELPTKEVYDGRNQTD